MNDFSTIYSLEISFNASTQNLGDWPKKKERRKKNFTWTPFNKYPYLLNLMSSQHSPLHIARRTYLLITFLFILFCPRSMDVPHDSISHTLPSLLSSFSFSLHLLISFVVYHLDLFYIYGGH